MDVCRELDEIVTVLHLFLTLIVDTENLLHNDWQEVSDHFGKPLLI